MRKERSFCVISCMCPEKSIRWQYPWCVGLISYLWRKSCQCFKSLIISPINLCKKLSCKMRLVETVSTGYETKNSCTNTFVSLQILLDSIQLNVFATACLNKQFEEHGWKTTRRDLSRKCTHFWHLWEKKHAQQEVVRVNLDIRRTKRLPQTVPRPASPPPEADCERCEGCVSLWRPLEKNTNIISVSFNTCRRQIDR